LTGAKHPKLNMTTTNNTKESRQPCKKNAQTEPNEAKAMRQGNGPWLFHSSEACTRCSEDGL